MNYFGSNIRLLRNRRRRTQNDVAAALEIKRTTVNALENTISQPTLSHLQAYSGYFGIAIDTLVNVDLGHLSESQFTDLENGFDVYIRGSNLRVIATTVDSGNRDNIEFVSQKAKAGYVAGFADPEYMASLPVFQLPFLSSEKKYRAFAVSGDSMLPVPDGAIVVGEFVSSFYDIKNGEGYIVVTRNDGVVFKIAENRIRENRTVLLISLNASYKPFEVPVNEIREVWKFVCYLNQELPEPETDIQKVLKTVNDLKQELLNLKQ